MTITSVAKTALVAIALSTSAQAQNRDNGNNNGNAKNQVLVHKDPNFNQTSVADLNSAQQQLNIKPAEGFWDPPPN